MTRKTQKMTKFENWITKKNYAVTYTENLDGVPWPLKLNKLKRSRQIAGKQQSLTRLRHIGIKTEKEN